MHLDVKSIITLIQGQKATDRADIFSFSLVLWELLTRSTAYDVMHPHILIYGVVVRKLRPDTGILTVDGLSTFTVFLYLCR